MNRPHIRIALVLLLALFSVTLTAETLRQPVSTAIFIAPGSTAQQLAGRGIPVIGIAAKTLLDAQGREVVWREVRRETEEDGQLHVFYRQFVSAEGASAELFGSEIGVHYGRNGALRFLGGTQFDNVRVTNLPRFDRAEAVERAADRLRTHFAARGIAGEDRGMRQQRIAETKLRAVQVANDEFRFAWFTTAADAEGHVHEMIIDAQDDRILAIHEPAMHSNCGASTPIVSVAATGVPVRPGVPARSLKANQTSSRPFPFTHEGYYQYSSPSQSVYQQTNQDEMKCNTAHTTSYSLVPLRTNASGVPVYEDFNHTTEAWKGSAAGDALYHTYQTMRALASYGRAGWDNANSEAKIVVESTVAGSDVASFVYTSTSYAPRYSVTIGRASRMYNGAAALDLVAHEWGHGVIFTSANFPTSTSVGVEMHEGWADVIAHLVEKRRQPAGNGLEQSSDWSLQEDNAISGYARGAYDDNTGHSWVGPNGSYTFNDRLHRNDNSYDAKPHATGNMLSVVFRLLSDGGTNPVCSRLPHLTGCNAPVTSLGFTKASRILFRALTRLVPSTATWETIGPYVRQAAFDQYQTCLYDPNFNASYEQEAVNAAFTAIGYPQSGQIPCTW